MMMSSVMMIIVDFFFGFIEKSKGFEEVFDALIGGFKGLQALSH